MHSSQCSSVRRRDCCFFFQRPMWPLDYEPSESWETRLGGPASILVHKKETTKNRYNDTPSRAMAVWDVSSSDEVGLIIGRGMSNSSIRRFGSLTWRNDVMRSTLVDEWTKAEKWECASSFVVCGDRQGDPEMSRRVYKESVRTSSIASRILASLPVEL